MRPAALCWFPLRLRAIASCLAGLCCSTAAQLAAGQRMLEARAETPPPAMCAYLWAVAAFRWQVRPACLLQHSEGAAPPPVSGVAVWQSSTRTGLAQLTTPEVQRSTHQAQAAAMWADRAPAGAVLAATRNLSRLAAARSGLLEMPRLCRLAQQQTPAPIRTAAMAPEAPRHSRKARAAQSASLATPPSTRPEPVRPIAAVVIRSAARARAVTGGLLSMTRPLASAARLSSAPTVSAARAALRFPLRWGLPSTAARALAALPISDHRSAC